MRVPTRLLAGLLVVMLLLVTAPAISSEAKPSAKDLPERWRVWLEEEVYPLISREQKKAFLAMQTEAQRKAFVQRLWLLWGRQTGWGAAFEGMYQERLAMCRAEYENTHEDRARLLLILGPPDGRQVFKCEELFYPLEFWVWGYIEGLGQDVVVLFVQKWGIGPYRLWDSLGGRRSLYTEMGWGMAQAAAGSGNRMDAPEFSCPNGELIPMLIAAAQYRLRDPESLAAFHHLPQPDTDDDESASRRFMEFSALLSDKAEPLDFVITDSPRGSRGGKVKMGFSVKVPSLELGRSEIGEVNVVQLDVVGEISRETEMVDRFRYLFTVPAASDDLALLMERYLRPGDYSLRIKVEDTHSRLGGIAEVGFTARHPTREELAALITPVRKSVGAPANQPPVAGDDEENPTLLLIGPAGEGISGLQRFEAVTSEAVSKVSFFIDEREILTKNKEPFDVDLDLGPLPRLTKVTAVAWGDGGREIDRKQLALNIGRERFFLRIKPPGRSDPATGKVRVAVEVNTPGDRTLERLELYLNERLLATLFQEPFEAWVSMSAADQYGYLRAVAVLDDSSQAEDLQFVNAPQFGSLVEVTAIELPVTVLDRDKKPIADLTLDEFRVIEDGVDQQISHFSLHQDLPVRLGLVIDTSGSMEPILPEVQRVVMGFLRNLLRPRDRAFIETFSNRPDLLAPFTADFTTLENALLALYPDRKTALYDSVILGLFQFSGVRGRRAMVVLTDGADTISKHTYDQVVDYAQRSGVTIYTVGIDLPTTKIAIRYQLSHLARVTGGRTFFLPRNASLDDVYEKIDRELRTQYMLAYTSNSERPAEELREVKVKVARRGTTVRTITGYYPGGF